MTLPTTQRVSGVRRAREWWDRQLPRVVTAVLVLLLLATIVGSIFPIVGDWLEKIRFGGPALMIAIALLFVDLLTTEGQAAQEQTVYEDSLKLTEAFGEAANSRTISIDFAGDSAETFKLLLRETLRRLGAARPLPESLHVRIMVPDLTSPIAVPSTVATLEDDPAYRAQNWARTRASLSYIANEIEEAFHAHGLRHAELEVRLHHLVPTVKLYVLNNKRAFWGLYRIEKRPNASQPDSPVWDTRGTNANLFAVSPGDDDARQHQFDTMTEWFSLLWSSIAYEDSSLPGRSWSRET